MKQIIIKHKQKIYNWLIIVFIVAGMIIVGMLIYDFCIKRLDDSVPEDKIFSYVNSNYELLESFPYEKIENFNAIHTGYENYKARGANEKKS